MLPFNEHLRAIRKQNKSTQKQVAIAVEVTERNYQDWEYGNIKPGFEAIIKLCKYFDISADYLLGLTDNPEVNK